MDKRGACLSAASLRPSHFLRRIAGNPAGGRDRAVAFFCLAFLGETREVSGCRAAPGKVVRRKQRLNYALRCPARSSEENPASATKKRDRRFLELNGTELSRTNRHCSPPTRILNQTARALPCIYFSTLQRRRPDRSNSVR